MGRYPASSILHKKCNILDEMSNQCSCKLKIMHRSILQKHRVPLNRHALHGFIKHAYRHEVHQWDPRKRHASKENWSYFETPIYNTNAMKMLKTSK